MAERLQKWIAQTGACSRRQAEDLIREGRVSVNGAPAVLGQSVEPEHDLILIDGSPIREVEQKTYIMLNKPRGYVTTTSDEKGRKTVMDLIDDLNVRVYPVGRLDMFSQGLLLLTNDGELAKRLTHPSHGAEKQYQVRVTGDVKKALPILRGKMSLDGRPLKPCNIRLLSESEDSALLLFCISEGRNRQIRRMCELGGLRVVRLRRIAEAGLRLGNLPEGEWRYLTQEELHQLRQL